MAAREVRRQEAASSTVNNIGVLFTMNQLQLSRARKVHNPMVA